MGYTQDLWIVWWRASGKKRWIRGPIVPGRTEAQRIGQRIRQMHAAEHLLLERFRRLDVMPKAPGMGELYTLGGSPIVKRARRRRREL